LLHVLHKRLQTTAQFTLHCCCAHMIIYLMNKLPYKTNKGS